MRRAAFHLLLLCSLVLTGLLAPAASPLVAQTTPDPGVAPAFVPGQLIIRFQPDATPEQIDAFYKEYGLSEMDDLNRSPVADTRPLKLAFVPVEVTQALLDTLQRDPRIVYAEPNYVLQIAQTPPNDPDFSKLWGLHNTGQTGGTVGADISALDGWKVTTGSEDVVVVVIDTGVDYNHEDLGPNMWVNKAECPQGYGKCVPNGQDDDGNGYIDDFYGINAITNSGDPMDDFGHGTHVAGTIGAQGNNSLGIVGVNHNVSIVACKFLSASGGGTVADAVKCFNYVDNLKNKQGVNIVATNNSWGGGGASQALRDAMAGPNQPLHICAAGNSNTDTPHYPAAFDLPNLIAVAATDHNDQYANFSNYGPWVHLAAPGASIYSTMPKGSCPLCDPSGYGLASGTSMATPHVAGAAALIKAKYPNLTLAQIRQRLMTGLDPLSDTSKTTMSNGRLNVFNTLEDDEIPPAAVTDLAVTALLLTQVELTWTATGDDGMTGNANAYDIRFSTTPLNAENWENATRVPGTPKPLAPGSTETFRVGGLEPDTTYYLGLKVLDNVGNASPLSNIVIAKTSAGTIVFEDDMESGEGGWTAVGTHDLWHLSEFRANSPTHAWYYGDKTKRNYDTGSANSGTLTSPPIDLTTNADVLLTFYEWSQTESSPAFDRTRVQLSTDGGTTWSTVFESHGTDDKWIKRAVSLTSFVGDTKTIHVRFWFDTVDNRFNNFEGWYIDDVQVLVAQPSAPGEGPALPNLVMLDANIGLSKPSPVMGEDVTVSAVILNTGDADAADVQVQFMDASGESAAPIGPPQTIANIPAGGNAIAQMLYDTTDKAGLRTLHVVVDPLNLITETNEADNEASRAFTVTMPAMANLVIDQTNIVFNPAAPIPGDQVTIHAVVRNDGGVEAESVAVQFLDITDSSQVVPIGVPQTIALLEPGAVATAEVTYDTTGMSGDRRVRVVVDPQNTVSESSKEDNSAQATLTLARAPLPNLVLTTGNVGFDPPTPATGQLVTITATIFNDGARPAENILVVFADVTSGEFPIAEPQTIARIAPGGSASVAVPYNTRGIAGDRKLKINVDPLNFIAEIRETDNEARVTLTVQPPPVANLTVVGANIGFDPARPIQGEDVTVHAVVRNTGNGPTPDFVVQFYDVTGGVILPVGDAQTLEGLAPGDSVAVSTTYATAGLSGIRRIQIVVDPGNFVPESNEGDNEAAQSLTIAMPPLPNLMMAASNILFEPVAPTAGDQVTITAVVVNNGMITAEHILVQFVDVTNGAFDPIGVEQTIERIPPGASATAMVVYDTADKTGTRRIHLLVDSNNLIAEEDENDNEAVTNLTVRPAPLANLVVHASNIGINPRSPVAGQAVTVTATIFNHGAAPATDVVVQLLDVSDGELVPVGTAQVVPLIAAGGAHVVTMRYGANGALTPGERTLRIVVDPSNFIPETDDTDNRATTTFTVLPAPLPNLVVTAQNLGFRPATPQDGDDVIVSITVLNTGAAVAEDVLVQFVDVTNGGAEPIGAKQTIDHIHPGMGATLSVTYSTAGKAGDRRIRVVADPHSTVAETSKTDNEAVAVLRVAGRPLPNLTMRAENIGFSNDRPAPDDLVTVTATVLNTGRTRAENVVIQFVDATGGGTIPIAANQVIQEIAPGSSATVSIPYDTRGRFGERRIQVVVDPNNLIVESDENDNRAVGSLRVQLPPVANLVIRSSQIGFDPPDVGMEGTVTIYATVRNDGGVGVGEVPVQFLDITNGGSVQIGAIQLIPGIAAGGSGLVQVTYAVPAGTTDRKIQVVVDPNNTLFESVTSDNSATATLPRRKTDLANLSITTSNITFDRDNPVEGDPVTVRAVVVNNGAADARDVVVQFADTTNNGNQPIGPQQVIPMIRAGSSAMVQVIYDTAGKAGNRAIRITVDPNNFIPESRETDNTATVTLAVTTPDRPNLVATAANLTFTPHAPISGDDVLVRAVIFNHGVREARDVVVQFMDVTGGAQRPIGTPQAIARIQPGGAATASVLYPTAGLVSERTIQVTVDPNNFIQESNENDNRAARPLIVAAPPAPNLVMLASNIEFAPSQPQDGNLVAIHATVLNSGGAGATDIVVRVDDITDPTQPLLIGRQRLIDSLAPEENATIQVMYDTTDKAGERRIRVTVDPLGLIDESDKKDNQAEVTLQVAPPPGPNLVVRSANIRFTPAAPSDGQPVTITVTILNEGQRNAGRVEVAFYDVTNGNQTLIGDIQVIGGISAGASGMAQVTYDTTGKSGDRIIRVIADPANLIAETNETDNQAEATLKIAPPSTTPELLPNLVITPGTVVISPTAPTPGDLVTLAIPVANTGSASASGVVVRALDITGDEPVPVDEDKVISTLAAGATVSVTVLYDTTDLSGARTLRITADPDGLIDETNDNDNTVTVTIPLNGGDGPEDGDPPGDAPEDGDAPDDGDTPDQGEAAADNALGNLNRDQHETPSTELTIQLVEEQVRRGADTP
mgnify:CR=1 FL=1